MQCNPILVSDLYKSKGSVTDSMMDRASVHTGNATEQFLHRIGRLNLVHIVTEQSGAKTYPVQCEHVLKLVHCTLNKLKLTFVPPATLSHFTCVHGENWKGFVFR